MKQFGRNEDSAIDKLLRQTARQSRLERSCQQFDPDLANAYVERSLTGIERERYELHLSLCGGCRTATVALAKLAKAEAPAQVGERREVGVAGLLGSLEAAVAALATPRWGMAAAAVIVLAVSIPVLVSQVSVQKRAASETPAQPPEAQSAARFDERPASSQTAPEPVGSSDSLAKEMPQARAVESQAVVVGAASAKTGDREQFASNRALGQEGAVTAQSLDQLKEKAEVAAAAPAAATQPQPELARQQEAASAQPASEDAQKLAQIDPDAARRLPREEKDSAQVSVLKSGRPDGEHRASQERIRPEDNIAPAAPATSTDRMRGLAEPPARSLRDSRSNESGRGSRGSAQRKIGGKWFWLRDDIWTDKDYRPDKEMPVVTIIRDSEVYKELINKRAGLKTYLTAFGENDRAIVVYKGTIFKLIPQPK